VLSHRHGVELEIKKKKNEKRRNYTLCCRERTGISENAATTQMDSNRQVVLNDEEDVVPVAIQILLSK
jgi:hypothetical protein